MMGINLGTFILILLKMIYFLNLQDMIFDIYKNKTSAQSKGPGQIFNDLECE